MEADVEDESLTDDLEIALGSYEGTDPVGTLVNMAVVTSINTLNFETVSTTAITDPAVDLEARFYLLFACVPPMTGFTGVRIYY